MQRTRLEDYAIRHGVSIPTPNGQAPDTPGGVIATSPPVQPDLPSTLLGALDDPSILALYQDLVHLDTHQLLTAILATLAAQVQEGILVSSTWELSGGSIPTRIPYSPPLFSIVLINDGPNTAHYSLLSTTAFRRGTLKSLENISFSFPTAVINLLFLTVIVAGNSATVRVVGTR